jgi:hypothetical protein
MKARLVRSLVSSGSLSVRGIRGGVVRASAWGDMELCIVEFDCGSSAWMSDVLIDMAASVVCGL